MTPEHEARRRLAAEIRGMFDAMLARRDRDAAELFADAALMAALDLWRDERGEAAIIEYLRSYADQTEAALIHAHKMTGKFYGGPEKQP